MASGGHQGQQCRLCWPQHSQKSTFSHSYDDKVILHNLLFSHHIISTSLCWFHRCILLWIYLECNLNALHCSIRSPIWRWCRPSQVYVCGGGCLPYTHVSFFEVFFSPTLSTTSRAAERTADCNLSSLPLRSTHIPRREQGVKWASPLITARRPILPDRHMCQIAPPHSVVWEREREGEREDGAEKNEF